MHPITLIELSLICAVLFIFFFTSFFFKGKWRRGGFITTAFVFVLILSAFIIRPYWTDYQIVKRTTVLNDYLEEHYLDRSWEITSVDFRKYRQYNPYHLRVTFKDEPLNVYSYYVKKGKDIKIVSETSK